MKMYKTSNWREIEEIEVARTDDTHIYLPPLKPESKHLYFNKERKKLKSSSQVNYFYSEKEAKEYLLNRLSSEIDICRKRILKAEQIIKSIR